MIAANRLVWGIRRSAETSQSMSVFMSPFIRACCSQGRDGEGVVRSHQLGWGSAAIASVIVASSLASLLPHRGEGMTGTTQVGKETSPPAGHRSPMKLLQAPRLSKLVAEALDKGRLKKGAAVVRRFKARTGCDVYGSVRKRQVDPRLVHSEVRQFLELTKDVGVTLRQNHVVIVAVSC
jgi:hypothetical protein